MGNIPWASVPQGAAVRARAGQGFVPGFLASVLCSSPAQVDPYLPYEYTCEGMLERIHAYIQHQVGHRPCYAGEGMGEMLGRNRCACEVSLPGMLSPVSPTTTHHLSPSSTDLFPSLPGFLHHAIPSTSCQGPEPCYAKPSKPSGPISQRHPPDVVPQRPPGPPRLATSRLPAGVAIRGAACLHRDVPPAWAGV